MAYTVLARKYRSRTFAEVIGQEPVATTLGNAIRTGRIAHGFLFTGTRGSGKTSMARILAKSLNCLGSEGPTVTPCLECDACRAIAEGQDVDVVEIDAASNTGVDNIRELRSNTAYRPARCRFKIYIIDEVHMLSTGAFNALLKTLEEPPAHVKFILATTELQKVPATIQSRCQRFTFRNICPDDVAGRLAEICRAEGATADDSVLRRVARLANGSMRDALSLLDQLLSVSPTSLTPTLLDELLPPTQSERSLALLRGAAAGDPATVLTEADRILSLGTGLDQLAAELIDTVRALLLLRACGPASPLVDVPEVLRDEFTALSVVFTLSQDVQMIALLEETRRNVRFSGAGRALLDAALVRLAHITRWTPVEQLMQQLASPGAVAPVAQPAATPPTASAGAAPEKKKPVEPPAADRPDGAAARFASPEHFAPERAAQGEQGEAVAEIDAPGRVPPDEPSAPPASRKRTALVEDAPEIVRAPADELLPAVAATAAERERILQDPVVQQAIRLLGCDVIKVEVRPAATE